MNAPNDQQIEQMQSGRGFIAALDQSGGSTPKALERYGVDADEYSNEDEMFDLVHAMRVRIMSNDAFCRPRVLGAILFEGTMHREVAGQPTSRYLWNEKEVLPFLKIDVGLADEANGVQCMKPIGNLVSRLREAKELGVFGTKMRSVIKSASATGIQAVAQQQFDYAQQICDEGMVPIVEPEIDIEASDKKTCEALLREQLVAGLDGLSSDARIVFKLTLPEESNHYQQFTTHEKVLRVAALSGGYSQEESNRRLQVNQGMIASFSRALTENLRQSQSDSEFSRSLDDAIEGISQASAE